MFIYIVWHNSIQRYSKTTVWSCFFTCERTCLVTEFNGAQHRCGQSWLEWLSIDDCTREWSPAVTAVRSCPIPCTLLTLLSTKSGVDFLSGMYSMYLQVRYGIGASMYVNTCVLRVYCVCTHAAVSCVSCLCAYAALQISFYAVWIVWFCRKLFVNLVITLW